MKISKKYLGVSLAAVMLFGSALNVSAAGSDYLFDADYYSGRYSDLSAAFGEDEKALWNHYVTYGMQEGRIASERFDVHKYRMLNPDLWPVFGYDWAAYAEHYVNHGLAEGRDGGGLFDAASYAKRYPDLYAAFGYDAEALLNHYETLGEKEGRTAASQYLLEVQAAAEEAKKNKTHDSDDDDDDDDDDAYAEIGGATGSPGDSALQDGLETTPNEDGSYYETIWEDGVIISDKFYNADGDLERRWTYTYDDEGKLVGELREDIVNAAIVRTTYEYDSKGRKIKYTEYHVAQDHQETLAATRHYEYDGDSDRLLRVEYKDNAGELTSYEEYTYYPNGESYIIQGKYANGDEWFYLEYDENGNEIVNR